MGPLVTKQLRNKELRNTFVFFAATCTTGRTVGYLSIYALVTNPYNTIANGSIRIRTICTITLN